MQLTPFTRLGPFEILAALGAGGMGEVYRARDTRLDRQVAIKILSRDVGASAAARERFEREARAISQLTHPHICTLFDVGHENGTDYIVMEYLEGETLADRLTHGPLSIDEVLEHGREIAEALDKAHRQGIVHRDLKPGNIMLTRAGAKLLDFGLAKLSLHHEQPLSGLTNLPTQQKSLTQEGTILGTFQYMAPEQLEGLEADARTDIFALGAVLYEMATARRAFEGKTKTSLIAAIVDREPPPISSLQPTTPPALEHLIRKCLEKDADRRWQSAADIATQLRWIAEGGSQARTAGPLVVGRKNRERAAWALAVASLTAALVSGTLLWRSATAPRPRMELALTAPPDHQFHLAPSGQNIALSPDGTRVVFSARGKDGVERLWLRPLRTSAAQPLAGAEMARSPFWSPDGRYVAFFAQGKLKKIDTTGGPPQTLCDANGSGGYRGGTWNHDNLILYTANARSSLMKIPANGGTPVEVTKLDRSRGEFSHRYPMFLPDGKHFLYLSRSGSNSGEIRVGSLEGGSPKTLLALDSPAYYAPPGYILFVRDRTLMAQQFDPESHELGQDAVAVAENVRYFPSAAQAVVATSSSGVIAYQRGTGMVESELSWVDRTGKLIEKLGGPAEYRTMSLSPDGRHLAVTIRDPQNGNDDIWIHEFARGTRTRLTFEPVLDDSPVWTPDGSHIVFSREAASASLRHLFIKKSSGEGSAAVVHESESIKWPTDISRDGEWVAFDSVDLVRSAGVTDVLVVSRRDGKALPVAATDFEERGGRFAPNGKWIAYSSNESGKFEVYVQRWPPSGGGKWQVSVGGGGAPQWRGDGKEIIYRQLESGMLTAVPVTAGETFVPGKPQQLFPLTLANPAGWLAFPDGQRFLVNRSTREDSPSPLTVIVNWSEGLGR